jgi:hypothetical protein
MLTALLAIVALHVVTLGLFFFFAKADAVLVDDHGTPITDTSWREHRVPAAAEATAPARTR